MNAPQPRSPKVKPGAEPKRITIKPRQFEINTDPIEVDLFEHQFARDEWEVFNVDGAWIGTVSRYTGSLDRKVGRLRSPGARRTLWSECLPVEGSRPLHGLTSRADAIRHLVSAEKRRRADR